MVCGMDAADHLQTRFVASLFAGCATAIAALKRRGVARTDNAPASDYAKWLVAKPWVARSLAARPRSPGDTLTPGCGAAWQPSHRIVLRLCESR